MKFKFVPNDLLKEARLTADPDEYDGSPQMADLSFGYVPYTHLRPNRFATASALAFRTFISGEFSVDVPLMPQLADAISSVIDSDNLHVHPLDFKANKIEQGKTVIVINPMDRYEVDTKFQDFDTPRVTDLCLVDPGSVTGAVFMPLQNRHVIPANLEFFSTVNRLKQDDSYIEFYLPSIAIAVLIAEDLDAGIVRLPKAVNVDDLYIATQHLLQVAGFQLENG